MSTCVQITPTMRTQYRCVPLYTLPACAHIRYMIEPAHSRGPAFLVPCTSTSHVNNTPLPPPPPPTSESSPPPGTTKTGIHTHSTSFPSPHLLISHRHPPRCSARKRKIHTTQSMAHVLVQSLLLSAQRLQPRHRLKCPSVQWQHTTTAEGHTRGVSERQRKRGGRRHIANETPSQACLAGSLKQ